MNVPAMPPGSGAAAPRQGADPRLVPGDGTDLFSALIAALLVPGPPVPLPDDHDPHPDAPSTGPSVEPLPVVGTATTGVAADAPAAPAPGRPTAAPLVPAAELPAPPPPVSARPEPSAQDLRAEPVATAPGAPHPRAEAAAAEPLPIAPADVTVTPTVLPTAAAVPAADVVEVTPAGPLERPAPAQVVAALGPVLKRPDGSYKVTLHLQPEALGRVSVTVELHEGRVDLHLRAVEPGTVELLRTSLEELRHELEQQGLDSGSLDVSAGDGGPVADQQQRPDRRTPLAAVTAPDRDLNPDPDPPPAAPSRGLDVSL